MAVPSGRQKGINDFFSVTGVITSSPNKSSRSGSAAKQSAFHLSSSTVMDDDDDESLLAAVDVNNDDIDDASLLAAMEDEDAVDADDDTSLLPAESRAMQETAAVDHLEGMTPEMFGADDVFDEEVEALPDAHYGLLGGRRDLVQPQGCVDDLPEEILRQILCEIPARDLYCSVSLVCQRWRNIILDPKVDAEPKSCSEFISQ